MAIYTPRGLKVRLSVPYAFGLMARLNPRISPFQILKTTEGIESLPGMLAFVGGIIAFAMRLSPLQIGFAVCGAHILGVIINFFEFYLIQVLIPLSALYSCNAGFSIFFVTTIVVGLVFVGWHGVLAFFIGKLAAWIVSTVFEFWQMSLYQKLTGCSFTATEIHFFNAYRLHASRIGATTDIYLNDEEMEESRWDPTFKAFAIERPEVVKMFTPE